MPPAPPAQARRLAGSSNEPLASSTNPRLRPRERNGSSSLVISLTPGWNTISFPLQSVTSTSGFTYHLYKFNGSGYQEINPATHPEAIDCYAGYWTYADQALQVNIEGIPNSSIASLNLNYGWNLVGLPFLSPKNFSTLSLTHGSQQSLAAASSTTIPPEPNKWIYGRIYNYTNGSWTQQETASAANVLQSTYGYWLWCWNTTGSTTLDFTDIGYLDGYFYQIPRRGSSAFKLNQRKQLLKNNFRINQAPSEGAPIAGARIYLEGLDRYAITNANGYFKIDFMEAGTYYIYALRDGYNITPKVCTVPESGGSFAGYIISEPLSQPQIAYFEPASGRVGAPLIIRGVNFGENSGQVSFNGIAAQEYGKWSSTEIWVKVPEEAASGEVVVTAGGASSEAQPLSLAAARELDVSYSFAPAGAEDIILTVKLNKSINNLSGIAFILNYNPNQLSLNTGLGKNGVQIGEHLSGGILLAKAAPGKVKIGITLPGITVNGSGEVARLHFRVKDGLSVGTNCGVSLEAPRACVVSGGSYSFISNFSLGEGGIVIRE